MKEEKSNHLLSFNQEEHIQVLNIKNKHQKNMMYTAFLGLGSSIGLAVGIPSIINALKDSPSSLLTITTLSLSAFMILGFTLPKYLEYKKEKLLKDKEENEKNEKKIFNEKIEYIKLFENSREKFLEQLKTIEENNSYYKKYLEQLQLINQEVKANLNKPVIVPIKNIQDCNDIFDYLLGMYERNSNNFHILMQKIDNKTYDIIDPIHIKEMMDFFSLPINHLTLKKAIYQFEKDLMDYTIKMANKAQYSKVILQKIKDIPTLLSSNENVEHQNEKKIYMNGTEENENIKHIQHTCKYF